MKTLHKAALVGFALTLYSTVASADLTSMGILDTVVEEFHTSAASWEAVIMNAATYLFWTLGTISLVWTFGFMALRKADIGEFFSEFIRFILFFGFYLWLLRNGPSFADSIIQSLRQIGRDASHTTVLNPSDIVDVGFLIFKQAILNITVFSLAESLLGVTMSLGILLMLAIIAVNMVLQLASAWILMYAGIFFLGFGGSRWTSEMAINYYKTVLGVGAQIMTMTLLIGIGSTLLTKYYKMMDPIMPNFQEMAVMLVFCVTLLMLVNRVPAMVASVITGASGGAGIGQHGVGSVMAAASMAAGAVATGGAAVAAGAAQVGGGLSALSAAFSKASNAASTGSSAMSALLGGSDGGGGSSGGDGSSGSGGSPFAQAAGFSSSGSGGDSSSGSSSSNSSGNSKDKSKDSGKASNASNSAGKAPKSEPESASGIIYMDPHGKVISDAVGHLANGAAKVAQKGASNLIKAAQNRVANTWGGKIAAAIREQAEPTFGENTLAASPSDADRESEVAAFVNRDQDNNDTTA